MLSIRAYYDYVLCVDTSFLPTVTKVVAAPEKREHHTSKYASLGPEGDITVRKEPVYSEHNA